MLDGRYGDATVSEYISRFQEGPKKSRGTDIQKTLA
jgi:hypothetical protein